MHMPMGRMRTGALRRCRREAPGYAAARFTLQPDLRGCPSYATAFLPSMVFMTRSVTTMSAMPIGRQMSQLRMKPAKM